MSPPVASDQFKIIHDCEFFEVLILHLAFFFPYRDFPYCFTLFHYYLHFSEMLIFLVCFRIVLRNIQDSINQERLEIPTIFLFLVVIVAI